MSNGPSNATYQSVSHDEHPQDYVSEISHDGGASIRDSVSVFDRHGSIRSTRDERILTPNIVEIASTEHSTLPPDFQRKLLAEPKVENYGKTASVELRSPHSFWAVKGRTTTVILLCYLAALVFAFAHYGLFTSLDERPVTSGKIISQSHATAVSTLFVTLFRVCLVGSLGAAFTQHLWRIFRRRSMTVSTIESLFHLRSNVLSFANAHAIINAPALVLLAIVAWLIPIVTIFPPGAITIGTQSVIASHMMNVSVLDPSNGNDTSTALNRSLSTVLRKDKPDERDSRVYMEYNGPTPSLSHLASYITSTGNLPSIPPPSGPNSSYGFSFDGPYFKCDQKASNVTYNSIHYDDQFGVRSLVYETKWDSPYSEASFVSHAIEPGSANFTNFYHIRKARFVGGFTNYSKIHQGESDQEIQSAFDEGSKHYDGVSVTIGMVKEWTNITCRPYIARYTTNFTYINGEQNVTWAITGLKPMNFTDSQSSAIQRLGPITYDYTDEMFNEWTKSKNLSEFYRNNNIEAIIESVIQPLQGNTSASSPYGGFLEAPLLGPYELANGTMVELNSVRAPDDTEYTYAGNTGHIAQTVFNPNRLSNTSVFDPRTDFDISEATINAALANVSISSVILETWYRELPVQSTEFQNVYRFSHPLNLLLPYFLSLAVALPFVILGIVALFANGVPAIDGGFVQIAMTTTGEGSLQKAAAPGCLGGEANIPKGLKNLKVRYGEYIGNEKVMGTSTVRAGFGTDDEIRPLRKRGLYGAG